MNGHFVKATIYFQNSKTLFVGSLAIVSQSIIFSFNALQQMYVERIEQNGPIPCQKLQ